jgi:hypothetical protein
LVQPAVFTRSCPRHRSEVVFRPGPHPFVQVPWCYTHDHVCRVWRVTDQNGKIWASASRAKVHVWFDLDALIGESLSRHVERRIATPVSSGSPLSTGYSQIKAIASWSYKRRQRAEAVA